jgi:hypothetical protein
MMSLLSALFRVLTFRRRSAPRPPPVPTPPPRRAIAVAGVPGGAGAVVSLAERMDITNAEGYICFTDVPADRVSVTLAIDAEGYEPYRVSVTIPADGKNYNLMVTGAATGPDQIACPALVPLRAILPGLVVRRAVFALATGERWTAIECSDFQLFQRFLHGEDIVPVLTQRASLGFNLLRVFGMCAQMFRLFPQEYGDRYWSGLVDFCALLARYGLYVEFVVFADATLVMPALDDQIRHWARFCEVVQA